MTKVLINEYSEHPLPEKGLPGSQEKIQRGTVIFPIQYYLNNTVDPRYDLPVMWHTEFELIHVLSGTYNIFVKDHEISLSKDDMCFIPSKVMHGDAGKKGQALYESVVFDIDMIRLHSYYTDDFISAILNDSVILEYFISHENKKILTIILNIFEAMKLQVEGYEFSVTANLMLLFGEIKRQHLYVQKKNLSANKIRQSEQLESVMSLIRHNYDQNLTLEKMADTAGLSPKYFCRLFKDSTDRSPVEYLNWFRINMACSALRDTKKKLSDIAYDCGFNDFSYFIKTFKRYKGMTPLKYRNFDSESNISKDE
ncbi:MAG: AraC family transcriptional regulator [Treponema sp.]|nr:AraC family transcriptional regulator [Treponema sp.]